MNNPFRRPRDHDVEISPAETSASEVIHNLPDPSMYLDDFGIEGPTIYPDEAPARPLRILGIGGTTSEKSWSLVPLQEALARAAERGCETEIATVYDLDLPMFRTDWKLEDYPDTLPWLLDEIRRRSAEAGRSADERGYLGRLLDRF